MHLSVSDKCVSVALMVHDICDCLENSVSSVLSQAECLELFVIFSAKFDEKAVECLASDINDSRAYFVLDRFDNIYALANKVASSFKGIFYVFLSANDVLSPCSFAASLRGLSQSLNCIMVHGYAEKIDIHSGRRQAFKSLREHEDVSSFAKNSSIALPALLLKRSAWILLKGFDESLTCCYELDFAIRAYKSFYSRIAVVARFQVGLFCGLDENIASRSFFNCLLNRFLVLRLHDLNALDFLRCALTTSLAQLSCFDEFESFRHCALEFINDLGDDLHDEVKDLITQTLVLDAVDWNSMVLSESEGFSTYEEDGLAAGLISCVSEKMYSGFFSQRMGPYATYALLRNNFSDSISSIKKLERSSVFLEKHKISDGFSDRPFGVNLIGHAFDVFGLGEALRLLAKALIDAGIPLSVIDVPASNGCVRESNFLDGYVSTDLSDSAPYAFNIICMSPISHARWLLDGGLSLSFGRYSIGAWFWETSTWPSPWKSLFQFVDAVWAASSLIYEALIPHQISEKFFLERFQFPAEICEEAVCLDSIISGNHRSKFNLPLDKTIFIFAFDLKSRLDRKNPFACIRVFCDAFGEPFSPHFRDDVCLVIKTFKPKVESQEWNDLLRLVSSDSRIILIVESLARSDLLQLYSSCDVFLSLHRSEGYGLGIAEALQLGLKVVVTGYGGNVDFCVGSSSYLVDYRLVPIPYGSYPFADGHFWAEPDLKHAAEVCRQVVTDSCKPSSVSVGHQSNELFSIASAGESCRRSLRNLYK